ncbi:MAG: VWA domain-containing protein, partial [Candidatus Heimdallarchaeota archaeon]|nr:VWA domain-containing protein [Candidatus Heimdallarchaeota archaeon]
IRIGFNLHQLFTSINSRIDDKDWKNTTEEKKVIKKPEDLYQLDQFLIQDLATVSATMANIKEHLLEIGKKLASRERRRRRRAKHGKLDFRRTIRKNLKNNGIMLELVQKHKRIEDPEIIILNDVSGSTRWIADWFFVICYTAQQVYKKIRVFEFDNTMVEVSAALDRKTVDRAMKERTKCWERPLRRRRIHSDYQDSLDDFFTLIKHRPLNKRTTILILGDCRDFEGMWKHDHPISSEAVQKMVNNSKGVLILNPESKPLWDAGDSVVKYYQQVGAQVYHVATLQDLLNFVFQLNVPK